MRVYTKYIENTRWIVSNKLTEISHHQLIATRMRADAVPDNCNLTPQLWTWRRWRRKARWTYDGLPPSWVFATGGVVLESLSNSDPIETRWLLSRLKRRREKRNTYIAPAENPKKAAARVERRSGMPGPGCPTVGIVVVEFIKFLPVTA